ncbi:unnamed protein product, partial [marine sediment metagenome]
MVSLGLVVNIWLWRTELLHVTIQTKDAVFHAIGQTVQAFLNFLRATWAAIKRTFWSVVNFTKVYYQELSTLISICAIIAGFLSLLILQSTDPFVVLGSLILLLGGYIAGMLVWYKPERHKYFRGISTSFNIFVSFVGLRLGTVSLYNAIFLPVSLISLGLVVNIWLWRTELLHVTIQTKDAVFHAIGQTVQAFLNFLRATWAA